MQLADLVVRRIIERLLSGENYRTEIVKLIDAEFLEFAVDFFRSVVSAKLGQPAAADWYREEFLTGDDKEAIAVHAGLNLKTIRNLYGTASRRVVLEVSQAHHTQLRALIDCS
ncbi:MAG: CfrBI family restriction endonuclease [Aggregatilineales bacterium]